MLLEEFLRPLGLSQTALAERIHVSYPRVNELINGKRGVTPDTALRLAKLLGTTAEFWLDGQRNWDLWQAMHSEAAKEIERIEQLTAAGS
jgi:addiction module HigA family antidote